ncbi:uncharacterized protein LOC126677715 [Mercurialis annua]|uniref:uncharacterized protein LOC126677715 n=1 Tax=Mercurialis annua TaxID=3986 RepID=UPI0024AFF9D9|nr:uncharacterized protein LOC126677715 [Mercurialis annua]
MGPHLIKTIKPTTFLCSFFSNSSSPSLSHIQPQTMSSLIRNTSALNLSAPPPSPIPTGKGSRSAANENFSEYLDKTFNIPDLSLPAPHFPLYNNNDYADHDHDHDHDDDRTDTYIPEKIDYRLLELGDYETIDRLLRSAREFGVFMIIDHEIFYDHDDRDLLPLLHVDVDRVFCDLEKGSFGNEKKGNISWVRSSDKRMKCTRSQFVTDRYGSFSEKMEIIASKLDEMAEQLRHIFVENIARLQFGSRIQGNESVLSLYRYSGNHSSVQNPLSSTDQTSSKHSDHTLCLHLPATRSQFHVQSASGPLSFHVGPDTIVVTVGQRIEEWSMGDFKCVSSELICEPELEANNATFSIELKCKSLDLDASSNKNNCNTITIRHQILVMVVIIFLYKIIMFLFS